METIIKVNNFSKNYGSFQAIKNISFTVEKGTIVGFVGKNGAGKSTTIRCLCNMLMPTSGELTIFDKDCVKDVKEIKKRVSYMPSEIEFYDDITSMELFKFAAEFKGSNFDKAVELSKYFELNIKKKISELSMGNKKKVSIIITLMKEADLIILDEPTSGLDPLMQSKFFALILEAAKNGCTIFMSSHNLSEVDKYCSRALIIKDGIIADDLNMAQVKINNNQVVSYKTKTGENKHYEYKGDINALIKSLSLLELESLEIKNKSVEEEFIDYYIGGENHE